MYCRAAQAIGVVGLFLLMPIAARNATPAHESFPTGDRCIACHGDLRDDSGTEVLFGHTWRASMMANSSRDPYWLAAVRREVMDHPSIREEIENDCATCHMPMAHVAATNRGQRVRVLPHAGTNVANELANDGVSCALCHRIRGDNLGREESFSGGFLVDSSTTVRELFGPFEVDRGRQRIMQSATLFTPVEAGHLGTSEFCATCHTLYTHALNERGEKIGRLPEQVPYLEWRHSAYAKTHSCQHCHMPTVAEAPISSVLGQPRAEVSQHTFDGGNAFMLRMLGKYRDQLGVVALPQELELAAERTERFLKTQTARLAITAARLADARLEFAVSIENLSGHKFPTAYPSRRAWLHVHVTDARGRTIFESGSLSADGSIVGNDNDAFATAFEPHYDHIERADQVQIYESIIIDAAGQVTTGLLRGVRYIKDNRLLPQGFDKAAAHADYAVYGHAVTDANFRGGQDTVSYRVALDEFVAPLTISARLLFQTVGYRWAYNLKAYDAAETRRFVAYYRDLAAESAVAIAAARATLAP